MKKLLLVIALLFGALNLNAFDITDKTGGITGTIVDEAGLTYNNTFDADLRGGGDDRVSAIVTYTSTTYSEVSFSTNAITMTGSSIELTSHGFTTGTELLLTETAGTVPVPLVDQTTYYAIRVDADNIKVATTSAQAVSGDYIVFISTSEGTETYTLTPLAITGTPSFKWQVSNDGSVFADHPTASSTTLSAYTLGGVSEAWDLGDFNFNYLRLNVIGPTTGGIYLNGTIKRKD